MLKRIYETAFDYRWYRDHYPAKLTDARVRLAEYRHLLGNRSLDFGGGMGYFSHVARDAGIDSMTYDPYVSGPRPEKASWNSVVALHVLEHSNDPDATLEEISSFLVPNGQLILAVPNFSSRGYQERGMNWVWAQPPFLHVFHFTASGLRALLGRHGFCDLDVSFYDRWDANWYADIQHFKRQRLLDSLWGIQPLNRVAAYRRFVAWFNSALRFRSLAKSSADRDSGSVGLAELQVIARLDSACL